MNYLPTVLPRYTGKFLCALFLGANIGLTSLPANADISRKQAATIAGKNGGKVLKVSPSTRKGKKVFQVKILTRSGEIRYLVIDAKNGKILRGR
ncbi:PepSY domain-containing protein [Porticoccus sp. GXU_MW_L64]